MKKLVVASIMMASVTLLRAQDATVGPIIPQEGTPAWYQWLEDRGEEIDQEIASSPNTLGLALLPPATQNPDAALTVAPPVGTDNIFVSLGINPVVQPVTLATDPDQIESNIQTVPEPSTMALSAFVGIGLLLIRRRK